MKKERRSGGIAPYGYRWNEGQLIIDSKEASVRRLMFELFLKHRRKRTVARILNELGHRTRSASLFSDTTIDRLLKDPIAKGVREVNGRIISVDPIVSTEKWEAVNNLLGTVDPTKQGSHLFTGRAFCACGGRMVVSGDAAKYVCTDCRHKILADDLEAIFLSQLGNFSDSDFEQILELWPDFSLKERIIIVEQTCERIVIDRDAITIRFGYGNSPNPFKAPDVAQQNTSVDETVTTDTSAPSREESRLTEEEAAAFLRISIFTLARKRKEGKIGYFPDGRRAFYSKDRHLTPYLLEQEKGPSSEGGTKESNN